MRTIIIAAAIVGGLLLNAAALNGEWWVEPIEECADPEVVA